MQIGYKKQREFLKKKFEAGQLSHAYLFSGPNAAGKEAFANEFADLIGCKFPDLMTVAPEGGKEIPIAKIREVQNFLAYKPYNGNFRMVIVSSAHLMNREAQSCFLKTLEEPRGKTILILICPWPELLLPTISSRCQTIKFFGAVPQKNENFEQFDKIINAAFAEKFQFAKNFDFETKSLNELLGDFQKYFRAMLFSREGIVKEPFCGGEKYTVKKLKEILKIIGEINFKVATANVNKKLALETLLLEI